MKSPAYMVWWLQFDCGVWQVVGEEDTFAATVEDEGALTGKGVHLRLNETVKASSIAVGGSNKAVAFITDQVRSGRAEVAVLVFDTQRDIAELLGTLGLVCPDGTEMVRFASCADGFTGGFVAIGIVGYDLNLSGFKRNVKPHEPVTRQQFGAGL